MLRHGWRTGAIVPELELETKVVNTEQYAQSLTWLQALTGLVERMQVRHPAGETPCRGGTLQDDHEALVPGASSNVPAVPFSML